MTYPKWVSRGHGLGEILCLDADEEAAVLQPKAAAAASPEPPVFRNPYPHPARPPAAAVEAAAEPAKNKGGRPRKVQ